MRAFGLHVVMFALFSIVSGPLVLGGDGRDDTIRLISLNLHGGLESNASRAGRFIEVLEPDVVVLQEVPDEAYLEQLAAIVGLEHITAIDRFKAILCRAPIDEEEIIELPSNRSLIRVTTAPGDVALSIYCVHNYWDIAGDRQARAIVDDIIPADPNPRKIFIGDFNDEHYSTQNSILESRLNDLWTDLGVRPSGRITWPSTGFGGAEGAQLIDMLMYAPEGGFRPIAGRILDDPVAPLSDHRLVLFDLLVTNPIRIDPPSTVLVDAVFDQNSLDIRFDREIDPESAADPAHYQIVRLPSDDEGPVALVEEARVDPFRRRVRLSTSPLEAGRRYELIVNGVRARSGSLGTEDLRAEYLVLENLVRNPGAESGLDGWEASDGMAASGMHGQVVPYHGSGFFAGGADGERSRAVQEVSLAPFTEAIDASRVRLHVGAFLASAYVAFPGGESRAESYDESEVRIDVLDPAGRKLTGSSSGIRDTLYWYPYADVIDLPPSSRSLRVTLAANRATLIGGRQNDGAVDEVFAGVEVLSRSHGVLGGNLIGNGGAESSDLSPWTGTIRRLEHHEAFRRDRVTAHSGDGLFFLVRAGGAPSAASVQGVDLSADLPIESLRLRGAIRIGLSRTTARLAVDFVDSEGVDIAGGADFEASRFEWVEFDEIIRVPPDAARATVSVGGADSNEMFADSLSLVALSGAADVGRFARGDVEPDGKLRVTDAVWIILGIVRPEVLPEICDDAADVDDDGRVTIADAIRLLDYLFRAGAPLPAPTIGAPGLDPTADALGCE